MAEKDNEKDPPTSPGKGLNGGVAGHHRHLMHISLQTGVGTTEINKEYRFHKRRIIVGSAHSCDIRIQSSSVSNVHAVVEVGNDGKVYIYDMASDSGVFVNEKKVNSGVVNPGDKIKIGYSNLTFRSDDVEEATRTVNLPSESMKKSGRQQLFYQSDEDFASLMLEDEKDVIEIFDYPDHYVPALQVAMYWGETILDIQHHTESEVIWAGQDPGVDLLVPDIPNAFPIITIENGESILHLTDQMTGVIRSGDKIQDISELTRKLHSSPSGLHTTILEDDLVKLQMHDITLFINYTPAPPKVRRRKLFEKDMLFLRLWLASFAFTAAMIFVALGMEKAKPLTVDEIPPEVTAMIFKPPKPVPLPKLLTKSKRLPRNLPKRVKFPRNPVKQPRMSMRTMRTMRPKVKKPMPMPMIKSMPVRMAMKRPTKTMSRRPKVRGMRPTMRKRPRPMAMTMAGMTKRGNEGAGAMAKGKSGTRGTKAGKRADVKRTKKGSRRNSRGGKSRSKGAGGRGGVETLSKNLMGSIAKALSGGTQGIRAASGRMRGYGGFDTRGGGGLGAVGTGRGGGGRSETISGKGVTGKGFGKYGRGRGAIGRGGNLVGGRSRPSIAVGDATETVILGGLDKDVIDRIIRRYFNQIRNCYERELTGRNKSFRGRVMTRFVISASGRVARAGVASSSLGNRNVQNCLIGLLKRIKFPEPLGGGIVEVSYPFMFSPSVQ